MKFIICYGILFAILITVVSLNLHKKSNFETQSVSCNMDDRVYPSGNLPGSYLYERNGLLKRFIQNNPSNLT